MLAPCTAWLFLRLLRAGWDRLGLVQCAQPLILLHCHDDDDRPTMLRNCHWFGTGKVDQPTEAVLRILCSQGLQRVSQLDHVALAKLARTASLLPQRRGARRAGRKEAPESELRAGRTDPVPSLQSAVAARPRGRPINGRPSGLRTGSPPFPPPHLIRPSVRRLLRSPRLSGPGPHHVPLRAQKCGATAHYLKPPSFRPRRFA